VSNPVPCTVFSRPLAVELARCNKYLRKSHIFGYKFRDLICCPVKTLRDRPNHERLIMGKAPLFTGCVARKSSGRV
jgi:hypothetical protein